MFQSVSSLLFLLLFSVLIFPFIVSMTLPVLFLKVHWCWIMSIPISSASSYFLCGGEGSMKEMWAMNSCYWVLQTGKYPGLFLSHAFKDARLGPASHPCSMMGSVFQGAFQKSCGDCFFKGLSPPKRVPANDCPCEKVYNLLMLESRTSVNRLFCGHDILFLSEANGPKFMTLTFVIVPIQVITLTLGPHLFGL